MSAEKPLLDGVAQNLQYGENDSPNLASKASGAKAKGSSTGKKKGPSDESRQKRRTIERNATKMDKVWQVVKKSKIMDDLEEVDKSETFFKDRKKDEAIIDLNKRTFALSTEVNIHKTCNLEWAQKELLIKMNLVDAKLEPVNLERNALAKRQKFCTEWRINTLVCMRSNGMKQKKMVAGHAADQVKLKALLKLCNDKMEWARGIKDELYTLRRKCKGKKGVLQYCAECSSELE
jgi:hypothetical protein